MGEIGDVRGVVWICTVLGLHVTKASTSVERLSMELIYGYEMNVGRNMSLK